MARDAAMLRSEPGTRGAEHHNQVGHPFPERACLKAPAIPFPIPCKQG